MSALPKAYPRLAGHENGPGSGRAHFQRLNALVDGGHVGALPATELRVWLVFERHADGAGVAWPGPDTIAAKLGISERNVRRAISGLVAKGFLTAGTPGRKGIAKRTITVPSPATAITITPDDSENRAHSAPFSPESKGAQDGQETGRTVVGKGGANAHENMAPCARLRTQEQPNEQPNNNTHAGCASGGSGAGGVLSGWMSQKDAQDAITRHGAEHCARVIALVRAKRATLGQAKVRSPKRLAAHLLAMGAAEVDFTELEDFEEAQEADRHFEAERAKYRQLQEDSQRRFTAAREVIAQIPEKDRDAWKSLISIKFSGNTCKPEDIAGSIMLGELVASTPDVHALLAEAQADESAKWRVREYCPDSTRR